MRLRPYQLDAKRGAYRAIKNNRAGLVAMPTGTGKGALIGSIVADAVGAGRRVLVMVHRKEIVDQLADHVRTWSNVNPAIERAEQRESTDASQVVVASVQSLVRRLDKFAPDRFDLVLADECFPAGTLIDGRPIESLRVGDIVRSYDHVAGLVVDRRITRTFRSGARRLVMVKTKHGASIISTPGHPFFVPGQGYVQAATLFGKGPGVQILRDSIPHDKDADILFRVVQGRCTGRTAAGGSPPVRGMRDRRDRLREVASSVQERAGVLFSSVQGTCHKRDVIDPDGQNQQDTCICQDEIKQPDGAAGESKEDVRNIETYRTQTCCAWGQRAWPDQTGVGYVEGDRVADQRDRVHEDGQGVRIPFSLQDRCGPRGSASSDRDRWTESQRVGSEGAGPQEGRVLDIDWVEGVSVLERGSDGRFGGMCPDGFVYNIEVEETHNYFANGVLVHNCHHALSVTWRSILAHFTKAKILGFTATPNRGDERALAQVFDCVAYDMTAAAAIMGGWLVPFKVQTIKLKTLDLSEVRRARGQFVDADLAKAMIKSTREAVVPAVRRAGHLQAIVFCVTLDHMHTVAACVRLVADEQRVTINVATVDGTTPKDERARIMAAFKSGEINWLCNVGVATEGFDAPGVECVVMLRPTLSRGLYIQMIGRGGRPLPGIVDGLTVDDMLVRMDQGIGGAEFGTDYSGWITRAVVALQRGDVAAARRLAIALSDKSECLVLDFAGNAGRHEVASMMDLLGGDYTLPERREAERLIALDGPDNLLDALERARLALASKTLDHLARIGDPFALFGISPRRDRYEREPTANHRRVLTPLNLPRVVDWREANDLVSEIARREVADLCTYSQAAILCRLGCPVGPVQAMSRREAAALVRMLAADQWRRPSDWGGMRESTRGCGV